MGQKKSNQNTPSASHLRAVADALPCMVFEADAQGANVWSNEAWVRYTGMSRAELAGSGWQRALHPDDMVRGHADWVRAVQTSGEYRVRQRLCRFDGQWRWNLVHAAPVRNAAGGIEGWAGTITDIDDIVRGEPSLLEQARQARFELRLDEQLRELTDAQAMMGATAAALGEHLGVAQVGYGEIDAAQKRITVHKEWNDGRIPSMAGTWRMDHFGPAFIQDIKAGRTVGIEDVARDARTAAAEVVAAYMAIHTRSLLDVPLVRQGRLIALLFIHHPEPRQWTPAEVSLVEEVCTRLWAAVERAWAERALAELSATLDLAAVLVRDPAGTILHWSKGCERLYGWTAQEAVGRNVAELLRTVFPVPLPQLQATLEREGEWAGELRHATRDGRQLVIAARKALHRDTQGRPAAVAEAVTDVTPTWEASAALEQRVQERTAELAAARDAAEAASRAKGEFLANMSHEIRTPMSAILGLVHLLAGEDATPRQAEQLGKIKGAAQHLLSIINDILDLSRIEAGKLTLGERDFALPALLEQVRSIVGGSAAAKGLELHVDMADVPRWLHGDETRLRQALLNYAGNAVKFTPSGRITLRARQLQEQPDGLLMRFEVEDSGIGIEPQQAARLFEAFEQADASTTREHGGTGLGLAITRRLAELMGGGAGAQPRPGGGSIFWFTARLGRGQRLAATALTLQDCAAELRQRHAGARVLVAEDNAVNREVALALLQGAGLEVDFAEDGRIAIEKVQQRAYDLVLMDMHMPRLDGLGATRALRTTPGLQGLPIVAMTANAYDEDRTACLAAGMDDFVSKPVEPQTLYATLLKWLDRQRSNPG